MDPSALSARDLVRDMYDLVLCHEPNPALSRIWIHLVRLEEVNKEVLPTANLFVDIPLQGLYNATHQA